MGWGLTGKVVFLQSHEGWIRVNHSDIRWRRVSGRENSKCSKVGMFLSKSRNSQEVSMAGAE